MLYGKTIAAVVPAFNEETQIGRVIETMPHFVDRIVIVDDCSNDHTVEVVKKYITNDTNRGIAIPEIDEKFKKREEKLPAHRLLNTDIISRITLIVNEKNNGVGCAIVVGYKWCRNHGIDCTVVVAGDGQMPADEIENIVRPVLINDVDYSRGERLTHPTAFRVIPKKRLFGNLVLSFLTKFASGYWNVIDTQTGFCAISLRALNKLQLGDIYRTYGFPNDMLIKLNMEDCILSSVSVRPVYNIGEKSKMKIYRVVLPILSLLVKGFFTRITMKYVRKTFHPIALFYMCGILSALCTCLLLIYLFSNLFIDGSTLTKGGYQVLAICALSMIQNFGFAILLDIQSNAMLERKSIHLKCRTFAR